MLALSDMGVSIFPRMAMVMMFSQGLFRSSPSFQKSAQGRLAFLIIPL